MTSTDPNVSGAAAEDRATQRTVSMVLPRAERTAAVNRMRYLEREVFDHSGHIQRGVTLARAEKIIALINDVRHVLGWLEIDLGGRWRWPDTVGAPSQGGVVEVALDATYRHSIGDGRHVSPSVLLGDLA
jgi:hypothetical protein